MSMYPFAMWDSPDRSVHSSMTRRNALKLARQGDARAIAILMNQSLRTKGITVDATFNEGCLWIVLEGNPTPRQRDMVRFVYSGITRLNIPSLKLVRIYGVRSGQPAPVWSEDIIFGSGRSESSPSKFSGSVPDKAKPIEPSSSVPSRAPLTEPAPPDRFTPPQPDMTSTTPAQRFATASLSDVLTSRTIATPERATSESVTAAETGIRHRVRMPVPLTQPVASQLRLMSLLKVLTTVTILVAGGSLVQLVDQLSQVQNLEDALLKVVGGAVMLIVAVVALCALFHRNGIHLHPKYAQAAYIRLGLAFLVNVGCALLLLIAVTTGLITPSPIVILPLFFACIAFWVAGCCSLSKAKGYHPLCGVVGVLLLDGAVVLSLLPDRGVSTKHSAHK